MKPKIPERMKTEVYRDGKWAKGNSEWHTKFDLDKAYWGLTMTFVMHEQIDEKVWVKCTILK